MAPSPFWAGLILLCSLAARGQEPANASKSDPSFAAILTDQSQLEGKVESFQFDASGAGKLTIVGRESRVVPLAELVKLSRLDQVAPSVPTGAATLILPGRDQLQMQMGVSDATSLGVTPSWSPGTSVRVPLDCPLGVLFTPPADRKALNDLVQAMRDPERAGEVLWLGNGDRKDGSFLGIDAERIQFDSGAGLAAIDRTAVNALGFDPALAHYPEPVGPYLELLLLDGSRLGALSCQLNGTQLSFKSRFGADLVVPFSNLVSATVLNGSVSYLAERDPAAAQFVPYLDSHPMTYGRNLTWDGYPLRLSDTSYERGLGTLPRTLLAYRLGPGDRRFQATIGQDVRAGDLGSLTFRILVDRKEVYVSPPVTKRDRPIPVDIDIQGGGLLILITEFGERGDVQDSGVWADARIIAGKGNQP